MAQAWRFCGVALHHLEFFVVYRHVYSFVVASCDANCHSRDGPLREHDALTWNLGFKKPDAGEGDLLLYMSNR